MVNEQGFKMTHQILTGKELTDQNLSSPSFSKRLVRSVSKKLKRNRNRSNKEDEMTVMPLRCLTLYGRGGGCKVSAEEFNNPSSRKPSNASDEVNVTCFSIEVVKTKYWRRNDKKFLESGRAQESNGEILRLPEEILEMCLVRVPLNTLANTRLVCRKWRNLTSKPRFMHLRREGSFQTPWLFLFGVVKNGFCSGEIHALDVSIKKWHKIDSPILKGRFLFSVASIQEEIYIVGGCSSLNNFGKLDKSSFKTHKGVLVFSPLTKLWRKASSMKQARSSPILGISSVGRDFSVKCESWNSMYENDININKYNKFVGEKSSHGRKFLMIVVGGLGTCDEILYSSEIYDSMTNKWTEINPLPQDFGVACSGVMCDEAFFVYSESDKLIKFDIKMGYWVYIQTAPCPPCVPEYRPKLVSCKGRIFSISVSWCEFEGEIGMRNKAIRKVWELDCNYFTWREVSTHPDAPMDWNALFLGDGEKVFGVEMFRIFGRVLDFVTVFDVSEKGKSWSHVSRNGVALDLDGSSCVTKSMAVVRL